MSEGQINCRKAVRLADLYNELSKPYEKKYYAEKQHSICTSLADLQGGTLQTNQRKQYEQNQHSRTN